MQARPCVAWDEDPKRPLRILVLSRETSERRSQNSLYHNLSDFSVSLHSCKLLLIIITIRIQCGNLKIFLTFHCILLQTLTENRSNQCCTFFYAFVKI